MANLTSDKVSLEVITFKNLIEDLSQKNLIFLKESHGCHCDANNSNLLISKLYQLDKTLLIGLELSETDFLAQNELLRNHQELLNLYGGNVVPLMKQSSYSEDLDKERDISQTLNRYLLTNKRIIALLGGDHLFFKKGIPSLSLLSETQAVIDQGQNSIIPLNEGIYTIKLKDPFEKRSFYEIVGKINNLS